MRYVNVAVDVPLNQRFSYTVPDGMPMPALGARVAVSFCNRPSTGIVVELDVEPAYERSKILAIQQILDDQPLLTPGLLQLAEKMAAYYHHSIGQTLFTFLPGKLRQPVPVERTISKHYALDEAALAALPKPITSEKQLAVIAWLRAFASQQASGAKVAREWVSRVDLLEQLPGLGASITALAKRGVLNTEERAQGGLQAQAVEPPKKLTDEQAVAVAEITASLGRFQSILLDGITGSGKTEVYLQSIAAVRARGQRVILLVPEIGLTPQLTDRLLNRLDANIGLLHSGRTDVTRVDTWLAARAGELDIIVGTRSALFAPLDDVGLITVDEEHDPAYKQQDGIRYHARDMAIWLAQQHDCPIVLGTATPSLETLANAQRGRYRECRLTKRAAEAKLPSIQLIDRRGSPAQQLMSDTLRTAIRQTLEDGHQVLLFLNRRGYAPTLFCHECGWIKQCRHCEANMVLHQRDQRLRCHHCGHVEPVVHRCEVCHSEKIVPLGHGTQRIEDEIASLCGDFPIIRVDRDSTSRAGALAELLAEINAGEPSVLIGTQMLAKGHHFPAVTLVGILDIDHGFYSSDWRAMERMGQLIVQVAGRAGRGEHVGKMLLQTHLPDSPLLQTLLKQGYRAFAETLLREREQSGLPPFSHHALLQVEAPTLHDAERTVQQLAQTYRESGAAELAMFLGPIPAAMARRAGMQRFEALVQSDDRLTLKKALDQWLARVDPSTLASNAFWTVDIDPTDHY